jgi:hypothetical protein
MLAREFVLRSDEWKLPPLLRTSDAYLPLQHRESAGNYALGAADFEVSVTAREKYIRRNEVPVTVLHPWILFPANKLPFPAHKSPQPKFGRANRANRA